MRKNAYLGNILLAAVTAIAMLAAVLCRVFAPAAVQVLSESSSALTWQARRGFVGFESLEGMSGSSPACPSHLLSLAVIII